MSVLAFLESFNLMVGDDGPDNSKHLNISSVTLPKLEEKTQEHQAGGAVGAIEIGGLGLSALTIGFKVNGYDPQAMAQFGVGGRVSLPYTIYGVVKDKTTGDLIELKSVARGRMVSVEKAEMRRGELADQTHEIKELLHYELWWDKKEIYFYDFLSSTWRVNGVDQRATENAILRIR